VVPTLSRVSPSDRSTADRGDILLPTEQVPTSFAARSVGADEPSGPVELPEIVSATEPVPGSAEARQAVPTRDRAEGQSARSRAEPFDGDDPIDSWNESAVAPIPVEVPGLGVPMRAVGRRPRVRKVTRVVRHVDPWSAFKVGLVFSAVLYVVLLTSGVLLWNVASNTGTVANVERWFTQFGWETFELNGAEIFRNAWVGGLFAAVGLTGFIVLMATLFNLVSDMVGGVRVTVLEEEVVERSTNSTKRFVVRRTPTPTTTWSVDGAPSPVPAGRSVAVSGDQAPSNGATQHRPVVRSPRSVEETTN
jgi:hypothetical protein